MQRSFLVFIFTLVSVFASAEIYQYKDVNGQIHFGDKPFGNVVAQPYFKKPQAETALLAGKVQLSKNYQGDHFVYRPKTVDLADHILVIAHGMLGKSDNAHSVAEKYIYRWVSYAERHNVLLLVPVFDDERFGNLTQGYGGYRGLFGKIIGADKFVIGLADQYQSFTSDKSGKFFLYGHSAGGQFANRFLVRHPEKVHKVAISAAGRYSYPNKDVRWPYGMASFRKKIVWDKGEIERHENVITNPMTWQSAASKNVAIIVGERDIKPQPKRPGHQGGNRIEYAKSWAEDMNRLAAQNGLEGRVKVIVVANIGHDSLRLTPKSAEFLFD